jgi:hypothetical protein
MKALGFLSLLLIAACSSSEGSGENSNEQGAGAATCTQEKYDLGMTHYQKAVDGAIARRGSGACASEATSLRAIASEATMSVLQCADFKNVIKTSPGAEPLRQVLAGSLSLKPLTDELRVLRDSQWQNWTGVENVLPGTMMATEPQGSVGAYQAIVFKAGGEATYITSALNVWETPATYKLTKKGTDKDPRSVEVTHDGKTETFDLKIDTPAADMTNPPLFRLTSAERVTAWQTFNSLNRECP